MQFGSVFLGRSDQVCTDTMGMPDFLNLLKQLQGSGDRHGPRWGAGAKPLHERARFPRSPFAQQMGAARPKRPAGALLEGGSPTERWPNQAWLGKKHSWPCVRQEAKNLKVMVFYPNIFRNITVRVGLPPSRSLPLRGRFCARCANFLRKFALGKRAIQQGLCPCTPPGTVTVPGPLQSFKGRPQSC